MAERVARAVGLALWGNKNAITHAAEYWAHYCSSTAIAVKTLAGSRFESLHELGFIKRKGEHYLAEATGRRRTHVAISLGIACCQPHRLQLECLGREERRTAGNRDERIAVCSRRFCAG